MYRNTLLACLSLGIMAVAAPYAGAATTPSLAGSWQLMLISASASGQVANIPGLATFTKDGSVIETDGAELVSTPASTAPTAASPGHGIWQPAPAAGTLYVQYISIVVGPNGELVGRNVTTMDGVKIAKASTGSTTLSGSFTTQLEDPSGNVQKTTMGTVKGVLIPHPALP